MLKYTFVGFEKATRRNKMYNGILKENKTGKIVKIPFGDNRYQNYGDKTKLNLYPQLITGNLERRRLYRLRHKKDLKTGFFSAGRFSYNILWS
tara:strand:- start:202 stop:480 length:279 start_codon:yes stop_codon:yes gene_type:complete